VQITGATPRGRSRPARVLYLADDRKQANKDMVSAVLDAHEHAVVAQWHPGP
jgi:hypothetical protein